MWTLKELNCRLHILLLLPSSNVHLPGVITCHLWTSFLFLYTIYNSFLFCITKISANYNTGFSIEIHVRFFLHTLTQRCTSSENISLAFKSWVTWSCLTFKNKLYVCFFYVCWQFLLHYSMLVSWLLLCLLLHWMARPAAFMRTYSHVIWSTTTQSTVTSTVFPPAYRVVFLTVFHVCYAPNGVFGSPTELYLIISGAAYQPPRKYQDPVLLAIWPLSCWF